MNAVDSQITIQSSDRQFLLGEPIATSSHQFLIQLEGQLLGWVNGDERAAAIATLLGNLAYREIEKQMLAQELLSNHKEISLLFNISEKIIDSLDIQEVASLVLDEAKVLLKLLRAVTNQLAIALDQAELYEKSRMAAQTAQEKAHQLELTLQELQSPAGMKLG